MQNNAMSKCRQLCKEFSTFKAECFTEDVFKKGWLRLPNIMAYGTQHSELLALIVQ